MYVDFKHAVKFYLITTDLLIPGVKKLISSSSRLITVTPNKMLKFANTANFLYNIFNHN